MGAGTLYLVPTPLGNLEDITLRALRVLREVEWIAAEDTRRARTLLQAYEISVRPTAHHAHNEHREVPRLLTRLERGESGALITDAGMPGISDPGFLLAREARRAGVPVEVLPGPSAVITALVASDFPPEPFVFLGYCPRTKSGRASFWESLQAESRTVVFFETPHRLRVVLEEMSPVLGERRLAIARELTKLHQEILRGTAGELLEMLPDPVRGELVIVVAPLSRRQRKRERAGGAEQGSEARDAGDRDESPTDQEIP
ncbi:MAG: 16S rRNA (cytidine(1402)-2'-O)-methyltransferase [Candidatus Eisenbacteria bacterium]|uniref:Ribosomal RNA small subunit methyltransferase I n=1 Tax=Eiseniibacteriota bacterium TaxID=2212470 RepID=A0A956M009_UNCEI|nr:16S rRNA (cytidine(1402)-2'-O)-methyltransferase [Candidatus Eisenbacteria bacterium]